MIVIPIVQGNLLRLGIALQVVKITSVEGVVDKQVEDFVPNPNFPVRVLLTRGSMVCSFTATMEGNVAVIEDKGTINVGKYALTVLCRDDDGNPMRFKQKDAVNIVDLTAEAGIVPGAEFETGTQWLDGAVFLSLTAQGGGGIGEETDPTVPQHVKAITQGNIDAWNAKQEAIDDLVQIRAGAAAGVTALQPGALDCYATSDAVNRAIARIQAAIDTMMGADDVTDAIDTFREIVSFLDSVEDTETLAGIIAGLNTAIAAKYTKPETGIPASDLAQAVRNLLALAGTAVQPSTLNGYALSASLAEVATTGSYEDLDDVPTKLSDFSNDLSFGRIEYGQLVNGGFYRRSKVNDSWGPAQVNPLTPDLGVLYIDVADNVSYVWSGSAFVRVDEEQTETPSVTVSATGDVSQALNPNTFYRFGAVDSLDLTLVAGTGLVVYFGRFSTSANWGGTGLTVPSGVTEGANNPTVEASKTYEFNIMDNVLLLMEV